MSYSPFVGPLLFIALFLFAVVPAAMKSAVDGAVSRSSVWLFAGAGLLAAAVQLALNVWVGGLGDAVLVLAVAVLLFATRKK